MKNFKSDRLKYLPYIKTDGDLSANLKAIGEQIRSIIKDHQIDFAVIEDVALGANGRVADLAMLNGYVRCILDENNIPFITPRPTSWKKEMIGNGQADKELTMQSWALLDDLECHSIKHDDISDSYFLAAYGKQKRDNR